MKTMSDWVPISREIGIRLIDKPKAWPPDGNNTLIVYRQVEDDIRFGFIYADGDGVEDYIVHPTNPRLDDLGRLIFSGVDIDSPPNVYRNANQIVMDGWCPYGYLYESVRSNDKERL